MASLACTSFVSSVISVTLIALSCLPYPPLPISCADNELPTVGLMCVKGSRAVRGASAVWCCSGSLIIVRYVGGGGWGGGAGLSTSC